MLSPPQLGGFQVRPAAARTISPEDLPFTISCSGTGCPSAWQLEQGVDIWELTGSTDWGKSLPCVQLGTYSPLNSFVCYFRVPIWRAELSLDFT